MVRIIFVIIALSLASCGNPRSKLNNENPDGDVPLNGQTGPANSQYEPHPDPPPSGVAGVTGANPSTGPGEGGGSGGGFTGGGSITGDAALDDLIRAFCAYFSTCDSEEIDFGFSSEQECINAVKADPDAGLQGCEQVDPQAATQCSNDLQNLQCEGFLENFPASCNRAIDYSACEDDDFGDDDIDIEPGNSANSEPRPDDCPAGTIAVETEDGIQCFNECVFDADCPSGQKCFDEFVCFPEQG